MLIRNHNPGQHSRRLEPRPLSSLSLLWIVMVLSPLVMIQNIAPINNQAQYDKANSLFHEGYLVQAQTEAIRDYERCRATNPAWAFRFGLLAAHSMLWRGMFADSLRFVNEQTTAGGTTDDMIQILALKAVAYSKLHQYSAADDNLVKAEVLCSTTAYPACSSVLRARGMQAMERGQLASAQRAFWESLVFARRQNDLWLQANAAINLGFVSLQSDHLDEAAAWSRTAYQASVTLANRNLMQGALGNEGWAYFKLGDRERALGMFLEAEDLAKALGNARAQLTWLTTRGYVYQVSQELSLAAKAYDQARLLAAQLGSKGDLINSLELLSQNAVEMGNIYDATVYVNQASPMVQESRNHLDELTILFLRGRIAAFIREDNKAERYFHLIQHDTSSQASMRLEATHELAKLYALQGNMKLACRTYDEALALFESTRGDLSDEESKLPLLTNVIDIYDGYIQLLLKQGREREALTVADRSRALTLSQGLGKHARLGAASVNATTTARYTKSTLLFYWLGKDKSSVWAISSTNILRFTLPSKEEISRSVERYRNTLLGPDDPLESPSEDGTCLYRALLAPVVHLIRPNAPVIIMVDGVLSRLNFETIVVPANAATRSHAHYWIEDVTLSSAPSLLMLQSPSSRTLPGGRMLVMGDPLPPGREFNELSEASSEVQRVSSHFLAVKRTVITRAQATPSAYFKNAPEAFAFIHFVAHATASNIDPFDSAFLLSADDSQPNAPFRLYARDIMKHPLKAQLVTISACYGSGLKSYIGEGTIGLSWAFLRAGAHNVIGALWEVDDYSTPQLMDTLYGEIEKGKSPTAALREAKLILLHGDNNFRRPYFWGPFQLYSGS